MRLVAIAALAEQIKAKSFTIDGEAVVLGPDGLSLFDELRRREPADTAILYAFGIEHDGEDMRNRPFVDLQERAGTAVAQYRSWHPADKESRGLGLLRTSSFAIEAQRRFLTPSMPHR
jgi:ATP-dependent DNA ligase